MNNAFAATVLILVALAGLVPFGLFLGGPEYTDLRFRQAYDAIIVQPWSVVVYAILFTAGAMMASKAPSPLFAVCLLPPLLAAIWPLFSERPTTLPVPTGAIVAFAAEHETAPAGNMGCPIGWSHYAELAGRFPLGAGQGVTRDGLPLTERLLGQDPGGEEIITILENHIPPHTHGDGNFNALLQVNRRTVGTGSDSTGAGQEPDVYAHGRLQSFGQGQPLEYMPPYQIVVFCEFTGRADQPIAVPEGQ